MAVDRGSDLIREAILASAGIGESVAAEALVCGDAAAVPADRSLPRTRSGAYRSMTRWEALEDAGIADRIMHRRHADQRHPGTSG